MGWSDLQLDIRQANIEGSILDYLMDVAIPYQDQELILTPEQRDRLYEEARVDERWNGKLFDQTKKQTPRHSGSFTVTVREEDEQGS